MRKAIVLFALLCPALASADAYHGNVALLGGRASGLGGAAAGLPEDDAAPFYNPACVALDPWIQISFSAQALQLQQRSYAPYLGSKATETAAALVPNASSGSFPWRGGRASFSAFTTDDESLTLNQTFENPGGNSGVAVAHIRRLESNVTYQLGPSYGRPVNDILSVGASVLYVYQTVSQRADEDFTASDVNAVPFAVTHTLAADSISQGLAFVGGVRLQPTGPEGRFTFGLSLRSGASLSKPLGATREQKFVGTRQADGSVVYTLQPVTSPSATSSGLPAAAMGGGSMKLGPALFSAQLTVTSAAGDIGNGVPGKLTIDGALGTELAIDNGWSARAGVFSRRSSVADGSSAPRIDQYGAALGTSKVDPHHVTDAALVLVRDSGDAPVASVTGGTTQATVSGYTLMITLGGAFRFAE
ncbi:MAG: hypothetical protein JST54_04825 [Deltaproteobacteria bacterium]|nr:hypothetical protein [Deltaproteobacteria bacterium]